MFDTEILYFSVPKGVQIKSDSGILRGVLFWHKSHIIYLNFYQFKSNIFCKSYLYFFSPIGAEIQECVRHFARCFILLQGAWRGVLFWHKSNIIYLNFYQFKSNIFCKSYLYFFSPIGAEIQECVRHFARCFILLLRRVAQCFILTQKS